MGGRAPCIYTHAFLGLGSRALYIYENCTNFKIFLNLNTVTMYQTKKKPSKKKREQKNAMDIHICISFFLFSFFIFGLQLLELGRNASIILSFFGMQNVSFY